MTEGNGVGVDAAIGRLREALPVLSAEDLRPFLHQATMAALCSPDPTIADRAFAQVIDMAMATIRARGAQDRAEAVSTIAALDDRLASRLRLRNELPLDRRRAAALEYDRSRLQTESERIEAQIRTKRAEELQRRVEETTARLDARRDEILQKVDGAVKEDYARQKTQWDETANERVARAERLEQDYEQQRPAIDAIIQRTAGLKDRLITKTVAGYLAWLGYASVPATGAVLAIILGRGSASFDWILVVLRSLTKTLPGPPVVQFAQLVVFFFVCLAALFGSIVLVDKYLKRFDRKNWLRSNSNHASSSVTLGSGQITRRSFSRLLSALPIVFGLCMVLSLVAVAGRDVSDEHLYGILQTTANTFIGSAITLLATAAFMMYAIRVIEPREEQPPPPLRRSWEFVVPPLALFAAAIAAMFIPAQDRAQWCAWALFMLLSSLSFAYGLVYLGIYKDADKAIELQTEFESAMRELTEPPQYPQPSEELLAKRRDIAADYDREYLRLYRFALRHKLPIQEKRQKPAPGARKSVRTWLQRLFSGDDASPDSELSLNDFDRTIAGNLIDAKEEVLRQQKLLDDELSVLKDEIRRKEELTRQREIESLEDSRSFWVARRDNLLGAEAEAAATTRLRYSALGVAVSATVSAALAMREPFAAARTTVMDPPLIAETHLLEKGSDNERRQ